MLLPSINRRRLLAVFVLLATAIGTLILISPRPGQACQGVCNQFPPERKPDFYVLNPSTQFQYQDIFTLQEQGKWDQADKIIARLRDPILMGHVLYQRYMHPTAYRSKFDELDKWLDQYRDHPGAERIHRLAMKRKPADSGNPLDPTVRDVIRGNLGAYNFTPVRFQRLGRTNSQRTEARQLLRQIRADLGRKWITHAKNRLEGDYARQILTNPEIDRLMGQIALEYLQLGHYDDALTTAQSAASRSGIHVPMANWVAGLLQFKNQNITDAAYHFEQVANSPIATPWTKAAGAYWAARCYKNMAWHGRDETHWLKQAAKSSRTFYGMIAMRALGQEPSFDWSLPDLRPDHLAALKQYPAGRRALALLDLNKTDLADRELRQLRPRNNPAAQQAVIILAGQYRLPHLALQGASAYRRTDNRLYDAGLYPVSPWTPNDGYIIDRALISAIIRQESRFDDHARNAHSGAVGVMQLLPTTAADIDTPSAAAFRHRLKDPQVNVDLGQRYLSSLLQRDYINNNLARTAAAYNAGPGNVYHWVRDLPHHDDTLLFLELLPAAETRAFVERVLTNFWIYRLRMGQPTPSLTALANGDAPQYISLDMADGRDG